MAEATPEATEEAAPESLPSTGASQPSGVATVAVVAGLGALLVGGLFLRRRRA